MIPSTPHVHFLLPQQTTQILFFILLFTEFFIFCFCADFVISLSSLTLKNCLILLSFLPLCISQGIIFQLFLFSGLIFYTKYKEGFPCPVLFNVNFM